MNSDQEKLNELLGRLSGPEAPSLSEAEEQWLDDFSRRYPFFAIPDALKARASSAAAPSLREIAAGPAPEATARLHGAPEASRFDGFYPASEAPKAPSTVDAIDDFLNTYGHQSPEEDELLERLIFNPVPDYSQQLAREEEASLPAAPAAGADTPEARLNRFILSQRSGSPAASPAPAPVPAATAPAEEVAPEMPAAAAVSPQPAKPTAPHREPRKEEAPAGLLSESLAKIYIKTRRYQQAYEILNGLSLRFPEKSAYFADQLRFLRKLIINQERLRLENQK